MGSEKILITGGYGFLGANLAKDILDKTSASVSVFSRSHNDIVHDYILNGQENERLTYFSGDITDKKTLRPAFKNITTVIHAAALLRPGEDLYHINVEGTKNVIQTAVEQGVRRLFFISSAAVYGTLIQGLTMNEKHPLNPVNEYGISKVMAEKLVLSEAAQARFPVTIIRPFNMYGPLQRPPQMIPLFISKLLNNEPITLNNGGLQHRDWIYIDDVSAAIRALLTTKQEYITSEIFNIGSGSAVTVRELAGMLLQSMNKDNSAVKIGEETVQEVAGNAADITKIQHIVNWKPQSSLSKGINVTVEWYQQNRITK